MNDKLGLKAKKNKTQDMVRRYLEKTFAVKREFKLSESGAKRFDFFLPEFNTILEIDGKQHFRDIQWGIQRVPCSRETDILKQKAVQQNGFALVRIFQPWLWNLRALPKVWKKAVTDSLYLGKQNPGQLILQRLHKKKYEGHLEGWESGVLYC